MSFTKKEALHSLMNKSPRHLAEVIITLSEQLEAAKDEFYEREESMLRDIADARSTAERILIELKKHPYSEDCFQVMCAIGPLAWDKTGPIDD